MSRPLEDTDRYLLVGGAVTRQYTADGVTEPASRMGLTVLIADDDDSFREMVKRLLGQAVSLVGEALTGEQAVALAQQHRPDVVVMDLDIPGLDGIAATRLIKANDPTTRVILLTAHDQEAYLSATGKTGADAFLAKRDTRTQILSLTRSVMGGLRGTWDGRERRGSGQRPGRWDGRERRRQKPHGEPR